MSKELYLAGKRVDTGEYLDVHFPYDQSTLGTVSLAGKEQMEQAIVAANNSLATTRKMEPYQKTNVLKYIVKELKTQHEEFSQLLAKENGKTINEARGEMTRCVSTYEVAIGEAERLYGEYYEAGITKKAAGRHIIVKNFPIGVVAGITPFNFPMNLMAHKVAPAIAAGCPIIIKPASATPLTSLKFAQIVENSGRPKKAFSVLPCSREVGQQLVEDERINLLSFTGSPAVGRKMKAEAGKKKVLLELGGNAGMIVDKEINDRDWLIKRALIGSFYQAGQVCISVQKIFIHEDVVEQFKERFLAAIKQMKVGNPLDEETDIGGIISDKHINRLQNRINEAVDEGAECLVGNETDGTLLKPTVLVNTPKETKVNNEEAFGPVVLLDTFRDIDEAIDKVNDTKFGLQVGIFSNNIQHVWQCFENIHVGGVIHDDVPAWRVDHMPYGGIKESGFGREGVKYALEDMTEPKILVINS